MFGGPGARHQLRLSGKENFVAAERFIIVGLGDPLSQLPSFPLNRFHNDDGVNAELGEQQGHHPLAGLNASIRDPPAFSGSNFDEPDPLEVPDATTKTALRGGRRAEQRAKGPLDLRVGVARNPL